MDAGDIAGIIFVSAISLVMVSMAVSFVIDSWKGKK